MANGVCKLTGNTGKFVDAHLIPKALTKPEKGPPFIHSIVGLRPVRRWSGFYDSNLVTQQGENILASLDAKAISVIRKHKLIWTSWGQAQILPQEQKLIPGTFWGIRTINELDQKCLRLFFLSLLWRAATTARTEFAEVVLPPDDLEQLRLMLITNDPGSLSFYPMYLVQHSSKGPVHMATPIAINKKVRSPDGKVEQVIPIFRFYFDGLMLHIHRNANDVDQLKQLGPTIIGAGKNLSVITIPYENSYEDRSFSRVIDETATKWLDLVKKF
jgi:hypothetical protein